MFGAAVMRNSPWRTSIRRPSPTAKPAAASHLPRSRIIGGLTHVPSGFRWDTEPTVADRTGRRATGYGDDIEKNLSPSRRDVRRQVRSSSAFLPNVTEENMWVAPICIGAQDSSIPSLCLGVVSRRVCRCSVPWSLAGNSFYTLTGGLLDDDHGHQLNITCPQYGTQARFPSNARCS